MADSDIQPDPTRHPEGSEHIADEPTPDRPPAEGQAPRPGGIEADRLDVRRKDDSVATLIPYRNPRALIAYYLAVFSLIPCVGLVLGPAAVLLGILGWHYKTQHPTARGSAHALVGIILGLLTTAANWGVVLLGVMGGIAGSMK